MSVSKLTSSLAAVILLSSCTTSMLWNATDPHEYVVISRDEIAEEDLRAKGLDYEISDKWNVYYVEKSILQKTRDYVYRSFATPVTVTVDVAAPVIVIGGLAYVITHADIGPDYRFPDGEISAWGRAGTGLPDYETYMESREKGVYP